MVMTAPFTMTVRAGMEGQPDTLIVDAPREAQMVAVTYRLPPVVRPNCRLGVVFNSPRPIAVPMGL